MCAAFVWLGVGGLRKSTCCHLQLFHVVRELAITSKAVTTIPPLRSLFKADWLFITSQPQSKLGGALPCACNFCLAVRDGAR